DRVLPLPAHWATGSRRCPSRPGPHPGARTRSRRLVVSSPLPAVARFCRARPLTARASSSRPTHGASRSLPAIRAGWQRRDGKTRNDRSCVSPPIKSKTTSNLLSQNLLELRLSIIDNPTGSDGVEVRLIVAACRGNDGGTGMRCQLHRTGAHGAGTTMDQDRLSLFQVTVGEDSLPRSLGGHRH